jgi:hypothetical protein
MPALKLAAWTLAILAVASVFAPLARGFLRGLHWALCLFSILEAGISLGRARRWPFLVYAAIAVVVNPFRPFWFPIQTWRLLHAAAGLWLAADHLPGRA